jgi:hypothetical protein
MQANESLPVPWAFYIPDRPGRVSWEPSPAHSLASFSLGGCRICQSLLTGASRIPICDPCLSSFRQSPLERCDVCGVPWKVPGDNDEEVTLCPPCRVACSFGQYDGAWYTPFSF